jgi:hypothetical protein
LKKGNRKMLATCKESVVSRTHRNSEGIKLSHGCKSKVWKDGYCKRHHPESVKARRKKSTQRLLAGIFEGVDYAECKKRREREEKKYELIRRGVPRTWIDGYVKAELEHLQKIIDKQNEELKKLREENNKILDAITVDKKMRDHVIADLKKPDYDIGVDLGKPGGDLSVTFDTSKLNS